MSFLIFLPIARRIKSASARVNLATSWAICITCSWYTIMPYVSSRIFSNVGWIYVIFFLPCLRLIKLSIFSIGPGRYNAFIAMRSSIWVGFNFFKNSRIPEDSNWKTPMVNPFANNLYTLGSSILILAISIISPRFFNSFTA